MNKQEWVEAAQANIGPCLSCGSFSTDVTVWVKPYHFRVGKGRPPKVTVKCLNCDLRVQFWTWDVDNISSSFEKAYQKRIAEILMK